EAVANSWRYAGAWLDAATGLYKMGLRYYSPDLARWTQPDPLQRAGNLTLPADANAYAYVGGNPVNFVDPTGAVSGSTLGCVLGVTVLGGLTLEAVGLAIESAAAAGILTVGTALAASIVGAVAAAAIVWALVEVC
ncbi:MAG TPA: RHS repeat-associated core domain-containing protein, partial [Egibacteraceae bacterium]|nr:RHS repeat-associated core domain-containing protein [Egibacteraceae bacterium]